MAELQHPPEAKDADKEVSDDNIVVHGPSDDEGVSPNINESVDISDEEVERLAQSISTHPMNRKGLKILFLSSDTGGGHRASAEALANQFQILFPGSTYDLVDVIANDGVPPYSSAVNWYQHLSKNPAQWKLVFTVSNSRAFEMFFDAQMKLLCERAIRRRIKSYNPDVVVSVHPMMTNVPVVSCQKISNETHRHLPMFTVVTDLGSAHSLWFANGVEKLFVGSEQCRQLAKERGKVPDEKISLIGLPIRNDFAVQAENMGNRWSDAGRAYQAEVRQELGLPHTDRKTLLVMGGGEGVGSLSNIVDALYVELVEQGIDAVVLVVCGRNEKLKAELDSRDWIKVFEKWQAAKDQVGISSRIMTLGEQCGTGLGALTDEGCISSHTGVTGSIRRMLSSGSLRLPSAVSAPSPVGEEKKNADADAPSMEPTLTSSEDGGASQDSGLEMKEAGNVWVVGLGFVTRMAEYMAAADILVTKAGPGTISEAAAMSLPVMLTSYLPGQEEGNVDFVIDGGFGAFVADSDPIGIAEELCMWLADENKLRTLSVAAKAKGAPYAARDIAKTIGESTLKWREINDEHTNPEALK